MDTDELNKRRQRELAQFLRKSRARAKPELAGIETGIRRRTAGLRREEVASLAGVSAIWYTWLEQGRDVQPSERLLGALAVALQLTSSEREYLHRLGRIIRPVLAEHAGPRPELRQLFSQLPVPGLLADHRWQVIGHNAAAEALLSIEGMAHSQCNIMKIIFQSSVIREIVPDWASLAKAAVSVFHVNYARNIDDVELNMLIEELRSESSEFAGIWDEQVVEANPKCVKAIRHWSAGIMRFEFVILRTSESREINLFSLVPADADSAAAWERLRDGPANQARLELRDVACGA